MLETLLGSLFGGLFRLVPELIKWLDLKDERKHELALIATNLEADKARAELKVLHGAQQLNSEELHGAQQLNSEELAALVEGVKAAATQTGVKWIDGLNALIRPWIAFQWVLVLWPAVIVSGIVMSVQSGANVLEAIQATFGPEEKAVCSSIVGFWYMDRSLRKLFNN